MRTGFTLSLFALSLAALAFFIPLTTSCGNVSSSSSSSSTNSSSTTATTTTVSASVAQATTSDSITFTAKVSPSSATGSVTFYDTTSATTTLCSGKTLSTGMATCSATFSSTGSHTIEADYGGSSSYASSSGTTSVTITAAGSTATTLALTTSTASVAAGTAFTLTAKVYDDTGSTLETGATGTVTFYDEMNSATTTLGSSSLVSGTGIATLSTSLTTTGDHTLYAIYSGDTTYAASGDSNDVTVTVTAATSSTTALTLSVSPSSTSAGSGVALAAIVTPVGSTGSVDFYDETAGVDLGSATLSSQSVAALTTTALTTATTHTIQATYGSLTATGTVTIAAATSGSLSTSVSCGYTTDGATAAYALKTGTVIASSGSYSTSVSNQNAVCVEGTAAYLTLLSPTITSTATTTVDGDASWYGLDAAVLDYNGGNLTIDGGTVTTSGSGGNMVYSYGTGVVTISNATLSSTTTSTSNNHGVYASGAGTIVANNVTAVSKGSASSIVATDNGGGTVTINGGSYEADGGKSAGIYSTGKVYAYNATFTSTAGEAAVIEGDNSINLSYATLNSSSTGTHRGVFLYQSMSGDANNTSSTCQSYATGDCFVMTDGTFNYTDTTSGNSDPVNNCSAFAVYNQTALILLTDVTINNACGTLLLSSYNDQWSNSSAYGYATLRAYGTTLTGDVIIGDTCLSSSSCTTRDTTSTGAIYLYKDSTGTASKLTGAINNADTGKTVTLTMDSASKWVVTGTSYLTALTDADSTYSNITCKTSGCTVYVGSQTISPTTN